MTHQAMEFSPTASGERVGRYSLEKSLARGNVFSLWLARDESSGRSVVLKILRLGTGWKDEDVGELRRRASAAARLEHPNVARVYDVGRTDSGELYVVTEYLHRGSLKDKLVTLEKEGQQVLALEALHVMRQVAEGLAALQQVGVVHQELAPKHIVLRAAEIPVLIDFELPPGKESGEEEKDVALTGADYRAPEVVDGQPADVVSNVYSLGVILHELLAVGSRKNNAAVHYLDEPISSQSLAPLETIRDDLTAETYWTIAICLRKARPVRFQSLNEFLAAIDEAIAAEHALREGQSVSRRIQQFWRKPVAGFPRIYYAVIFLFFSLVALGVTAIMLNAESDDTGAFAVATLPVASPSPETQSLIAGVSTETPTLPATALPAELMLLGPVRNSYFGIEETVTYEWRWPEPLDAGQRFGLYLLFGERRIRVGTVSSPEEDGVFRIEAPVSGIVDEPGDYLWQVRLESAVSGALIAESDLRPITFLVEGRLELPTDTPTPSRTNTPTNTPTRTPTPTPTRRPATATPTVTPSPLPTATPQPPQPPPAPTQPPATQPPPTQPPQPPTSTPPLPPTPTPP